MLDLCKYCQRRWILKKNPTKITCSRTIESTLSTFGMQNGDPSLIFVRYFIFLTVPNIDIQLQKQNMNLRNFD